MFIRVIKCFKWNLYFTICKSCNPLNSTSDRGTSYLNICQRKTTCCTITISETVIAFNCFWSLNKVLFFFIVGYCLLFLKPEVHCVDYVSIYITRVHLIRIYSVKDSFSPSQKIGTCTVVRHKWVRKMADRYVTCNTAWNILSSWYVSINGNSPNGVTCSIL